jgi:hypothetical protein
MVDTKRVKDRRILHFGTIDAELIEADVLAAAEREGRVTQLGNWQLGQAINHLAVWAEYAFTGAPTTPPWFVRVLGRMLKRRMLTKGSGPGFSIPGVKGGTFGVEPTPTEIALARLRAALERLRRETPAEPNHVFGRLTRDEWIALQLRHGELHLGFFKRTET